MVNLTVTTSRQPMISKFTTWLYAVLSNPTMSRPNEEICVVCRVQFSPRPRTGNDNILDTSELPSRSGGLTPRKSQPVPFRLFGWCWLVLLVHTVVVVVVIAGVVATVAVVIVMVVIVEVVVIAVVIVVIAVVVVVVVVVVATTTRGGKTGSVSKEVWVNSTTQHNTTQHKQTNKQPLTSTDPTPAVVGSWCPCGHEKKRRVG